VPGRDCPRGQPSPAAPGRCGGGTAAGRRLQARQAEVTWLLTPGPGAAPPWRRPAGTGCGWARTPEPAGFWPSPGGGAASSTSARRWPLTRAAGGRTGKGKGMGRKVSKSRPTKRRTRAEVDRIREAIYDVLEADHPMTVRQVFYRLIVLCV